MVALNFQENFIPAILSGAKRQTIRKTTSAIAGEKMQLFAGPRGRRRFAEVLCQSVTPITLMERIAQPRGNTAIMGIHLEEFAKADGFPSYKAMWDFFKHKADAEGFYDGFLIRWYPLDTINGKK